MTCDPRRSAGFALVALFAGFSGRAYAQQHDHSAAASHHAGTPVDCRSLAAPPWSGLPASDLTAFSQLRASVASLSITDTAARSGFAPQFGDIPTMGVHWVNRARMVDGVRLDQPDHLLFTRIGGRDSLVGVAYAFRGPTDAVIPATFASELAQWHDHANMGGGPGQTLHMLHVWFVPSPYGPFAGNNFFLPLMSAGMSVPSSCWIQSDAEVERLELVASMVDLVHRQGDSTSAMAAGALHGRRANGIVTSLLAGFAARVQPMLTQLDAAAARGDRGAWERAADEALGALRPGEKQLLTTFRDRVKGIQASTPGQPRR